MDNNNTPMNEDNVNENVENVNKEQVDEAPIEAPVEEIKADEPLQDSTAEKRFDDGAEEKQTDYNFAESIPQSAVTPPTATETPEASSAATKAMVLAIIAVGLNVTCACFPASIVLAIIALVSGSKAKKLMLNKNDGRLTAATICSIIALVMSAFVFLSFIFVFLIGIVTAILEESGTAMFIL